MSREYEAEQPEELRVVEQLLAAVAPVAPRLDRDRLMFLAGQASASASGRRLQASGRRGAPDGDDLPHGEDIGKLTHPARQLRRAWPVATAALAATSLALAIALFLRPQPTTRVEIVYRDRPAPAIAPERVAAAMPEKIESTDALPTARAFARRTRTEVLASNYLRTRDIALRLGLDALGTAPGGSGDGSVTAPTYRSLLEGLLSSGPRSTDPAASSASQM
ncbi:MAG: hypothetical protein WD872_03460 [Pirellulaceae bacterium]